MAEYENIRQEKIISTLGIDAISSKKRGWLKWVFAGVIILGAAAGVYMTLSKSKPKYKYTTEPVVQRDLVVTVSATGNLRPTNSVDVGIEISGTVEDVYVDYNDRVKIGQVLARLDTTKLKSNIRSSTAQLNSAKANLLESRVTMDNAKKELERVEQIYRSTNGNYPSGKEMDTVRSIYEKAEASYASIKAKVEQAEALLESNGEDLKKAVVRSPINGIVLNKKVEKGQTVAAIMQTPVLFTLAEDLKKMEVVVSVDEADIAEVRVGQKVLFTVNSYQEKKFDGKVIKVRLNSQIVGGVVTYEAVVEVDNSDLLLMPGMTTTAEIITKIKKDVLLVPNTALRYMPPQSDESTQKNSRGTKIDRNSVWILKSGIPAKVEVTPGDTDALFTEISGGGIKAGDEVIINSEKL